MSMSVSVDAHVEVQGVSHDQGSRLKAVILERPAKASAEQR